MAHLKRHRDVEFVVHSPRNIGSPTTFTTFRDALEKAVYMSYGIGPMFVDVLIYSEAGAQWFAGDDGVAVYHEDPDASVFERIEIKANSLGRIR